MDREHYIDWIISSLQSCDLNAVLTWLLLAQIYWKEILYHRQRGRCLVQTLLEHLFNVCLHRNKSGSGQTNSILGF